MPTWGEQLQELREIKEAEDKKPPTPGGPLPACRPCLAASTMFILERTSAKTPGLAPMLESGPFTCSASRT